MRISERAQRVTPSGIRRMFDLGARLKDPIDFSIGQPHFQVPPPVQDAAIAAIRRGDNRYTVTQGIAPLNEAVLDLVEVRTGVRPESSMITAGVAGGLVLSLLTLVDQDDTILSPDPYFICYENLAGLLTVKAAYYDLYPDFRITEERLEVGMREGVRVLLLNTPSNPTGYVFTEDELKTVAAFARRHDLVVISDEIYDAFTYDGPVPSILSYYDQVVLLGGFGKTYGMPGWRLGYAVGPNDVIDKMRTLQQFSFVCAPTPLQHGALEALKVDMTPYIDDYRNKRDRLVAGLSDCMELVPPKGAFYAFPKVPGGITAKEFAERAVDKNLLVVPGSSFSQRDTHMRLSFALDDEKLDRGIELLRQMAAELNASEEAAG